MAIHAFTTSGLRRAVIASAHLVSEAAPAVLGAGLFLLSVVTLAQPENLHRRYVPVSHHIAAKPPAGLLLANAVDARRKEMAP